MLNVKLLHVIPYFKNFTKIEFEMNINKVKKSPCCFLSKKLVLLSRT